MYVVERPFNPSGVIKWHIPYYCKSVRTCPSQELCRRHDMLPHLACPALLPFCRLSGWGMSKRICNTLWELGASQAACCQDRKLFQRQFYHAAIILFLLGRFVAQKSTQFQRSALLVNSNPHIDFQNWCHVHLLQAKTMMLAVSIRARKLPACATFQRRLTMETRRSLCC